jgi:hypothetical protein
MSFFEFPHTRTYDSDLGWLIKTMKEISGEYSSLVDWMNEHKGEYQELLNKVTHLQNELSSLESEIDTRFNSMKTAIDEDIDNRFTLIKNDLLAQITDIENKLLAIQSYVVDALNYQLGLINGYNDILRDYVDAKIEELINSLPSLDTVYVFNPVRGEITDIQTAVNDLYDIGRSMALTAYAYDIRGLTAQEYDDLELTALQYDMFGLEYINLAGYDYEPYHYMNDPFTGNMVMLQVVIQELADLHKDDALTATEYDALDIDASYYDGLDLSAYDYDWHGKTLVA